MPMMRENPIDAKTRGHEMLTFNMVVPREEFAMPETANARPIPNDAPIIPPINPSNPDSIRKIRRISEFFAPTAFIVPISSVLERTKEIGTMKAVGAKNSDILLIFLIESGLLGLIGGIIGASLGIGLAFAVSGIANSSLGTTILKVSISWPLVFASIGFSLIIGMLSGIIPAIQASKLSPVE